MSITLQQLKTALKIDYTTDDQELLRLIESVTTFIENYTGVTITPKKKQMYIQYWMRTRFEAYPFSSIDSVKYYNSSNALTTMTNTEYFLDRTDPPSVYLNFSEFPSLYENTFIEINYTAGYAETPKDIQQAIIAFVGAWYNNPEATAPINLSVVPISAQFILDNLKAKSVLT